MKISDRAEEILEKYWIDNKERNIDWKMEIISDDPIAAELVNVGYAEEDGKDLNLTEKVWG